MPRNDMTASGAANAVFVFDMDGVLSVYDEQASIEMPFNEPGAHYFLSCRPDARAISLARAVSAMPGCEARVLTRIWLGIPDMEKLAIVQDEHHADKAVWCRRELPPDLAATFSSIRQMPDKTCVLRDVPLRERRAWILVDDEPHNLETWEAAGGTGIQYVQPTRRVKGWNGMVIGPDDSQEAAEEKLRYIAHKALFP